jgi:hypothetical protein
MAIGKHPAAMERTQAPRARTTAFQAERTNRKSAFSVIKQTNESPERVNGWRHGPGEATPFQENRNLLTARVPSLFSLSGI